ncbi:peptide chain release factor N(5)-glutamine methyltransferase [Ekhidna sp. To15]|uniref:peptide chain release factor N(5)-glutamine methyltransferase n=1 Tax=Ekhidna sp. To15 TaxID=3395267 RepID=UPI003F52177C
MQNVKQIWQETAKQLEKIYEPREAENISYLLFEDVFNVTRTDILTSESKKISQSQLDEIVDRLLKSEPIQYVTGVADFYSRKLSIAQGALIPRPETEELCELIIKENSIDQPRILEVGVGSGCIAITLSLELGVKVFGTDVSEDALAIAGKNIAALESRVTLLKSDVLAENLPVDELDILVSNPPYIPMADQLEMRENVLQYEPEVALFVPNQDPIIFYKRIAEVGLKSLKKGGKLYFEIHEKYADPVVEYLDKKGYKAMHIHKDMHGKDRMVSAINSTNT